MFLELYGSDMLRAPSAAGVTPGHGNCQHRQEQFHFFAVALQTTGLRMKTVRFQLLETGLDVPASHVRIRGDGAFYPMAGANEQFALAGLHPYHGHLDATATAFVQLAIFATAQALKEASRMPLVFARGRKKNDLLKTHGKRDVFGNELGKPILADEHDPPTSI